jgi:hypothetical protein
MPTWKGLPWVVVALLMGLGTSLVYATAHKNLTCVRDCIAAYAYCALQDQVTEDKGVATCVTNVTTDTPAGCSDLLTAAGTACPQPVTNAQACTQAVEAAARCLRTCEEQRATDTCESAFSTCFTGC